MKIKSLKTRLILSPLAAVVITGSAAIYVGIYLIANKITEEVQEKVSLDLNAAREIYNVQLEEVLNAVRMTSERVFLKRSFVEGKRKVLEDELARVRKSENLDILTLTDAKGRVVLRSNNPAMSGDDRAQDELLRFVLAEKKPFVSTVIITKEELMKEGEALTLKANIKYVLTPKARAADKSEETSGMMIKAASPLLDDTGKVLGILYGGKLLNHNYEIVDKIKETVFQGMKHEGKDIGTATIFQGDLRIATNVLDKDGNRAVGTRIAGDVYEQVLVNGKRWTDRAFVVKDWYMTAYEPIRNFTGEIVGSLYVGVLEKKYVQLKRKYTAVFLGISLIGIAVAMLVSNYLSDKILKPIKAIESASGKLAAGDFKNRAEVETADEIGNLARTFNFMAASLEEREARIKKYAQQQIMQSEKMALLGQLSAGVAHEINNPLGAMLVYSNLLLEDTKPDDPRRANLEKIVNETNRCKEIVRGLLEFSRQKELKFDRVRLGETLGKTISLIEKQALFHDIKITCAFDSSLPEIWADEGQLQQVFLNILLNAAEAMEGRGNLSISTQSLKNEDSVKIIFSDTGCGIPKENISRIFDPFWTTKSDKKKTGLGLAISSRIIEEHEGSIRVESEPGKGTAFIILLPVDRKDIKMRGGV